MEPYSDFVSVRWNRSDQEAYLLTYLDDDRVHVCEGGAGEERRAREDGRELHDGLLLISNEARENECADSSWKIPSLTTLASENGGMSECDAEDANEERVTGRQTKEGRRD